MSSHQEMFVNRNPSQNRPSQPSFLDEAFARARARLDAERAPPDHDPTPSEDEFEADEPADDELLDGADLLRLVREPVEWILALAYRLACADPVDVAAVERLRAAFHARLAGRSAGIRKTDVLIVFGLLLGALDPTVVIRAVSDTIGDGLAAVLGSDTPVAIQFTGTVDPFAELVAVFRSQRPGGRRIRFPLRPHVVR
jgi:hypothetical protein